LGRSGKFNVNQVKEKENWQKEFEEMKKQMQEDPKT